MTVLKNGYIPRHLVRLLTQKARVHKLKVKGLTQKGVLHGLLVNILTLKELFM